MAKCSKSCACYDCRGDHTYGWIDQDGYRCDSKDKRTGGDA